jgi:hypothetical protein
MAAGGECAGIAVGQHPRAGRDQSCAERAHVQVLRTVLVVDAHRFRFQRINIRSLFPHPAHPLQRPVQVHRGRPRGGEHGIGSIEGVRITAHREHQAIGGGDADCRRAAHHHVMDRLGGCLGVRAVQIRLLLRQQALVEQQQLAVAPDDGLHG